MKERINFHALWCSIRDAWMDNGFVSKNDTDMINTVQNNIIIFNKKCKKKTRSRRSRGLLKYYDFIQIPNPMVPGGPAITSFPLPDPGDTFGPETQIGPAFITLRRIKVSDRVELKATVVWNYGATTVAPNTLITVISQQMEFSIWRDAPFSGIRVCTVVDTRNLTRISSGEPAGTEEIGTATTAFSCTDSGIPSGTHSYYLTATAGVANGFFVGVDTPPVPIDTFIDPNVTEVHFSGSVIARN